jgi:hypothetical protein
MIEQHKVVSAEEWLKARLERLATCAYYLHRKNWRNVTPAADIAQLHL